MHSDLTEPRPRLGHTQARDCSGARHPFILLACTGLRRGTAQNTYSTLGLRQPTPVLVTGAAIDQAGCSFSLDSFLDET